MHAFAEIAEGLAWERPGAVRFFCTQAIDKVFEDSARGLYRRISKHAEADTEKPPVIFRWTGYLWTAVFLI